MVSILVRTLAWLFTFLSGRKQIYWLPVRFLCLATVGKTLRKSQNMLLVAVIFVCRVVQLLAVKIAFMYTAGAIVPYQKNGLLLVRNRPFSTGFIY